MGVGVAHIFEKGIVFLADEGLLVVAGNIVPVDAVIVELVEEGQTVLGGSVLLELTVVGLRDVDATAGRPVALVALVGGCKLLQGRRPEPAVNVRGLKVGTFAALEVAQTTRRPDVLHL